MRLSLELAQGHSRKLCGATPRGTSVACGERVHIFNELRADSKNRICPGSDGNSYPDRMYAERSNTILIPTDWAGRD